MNRIAHSALALVLASTPLLAQGDAPKKKTQRIVELTVHSAALPQPALRLQLLPDFRDELPGNALPQYDTAALQLVGDDEEKIRKQLEAIADLPLDTLPRDTLREHLGDRLAAVLRYADLGARREHCVWELPIREHGMETLMPSLSKYRSIGRLLATRARLEIAEGRFDDAVRTLQTGFALARHTNQGGTMIHALVAVAIARLMTQEIEVMIQAPGAPNLYWALTALPRPLGDLRMGLRMERSFLYYTVPQLRTLDAAPLGAAQVAALTDNLADVLTMIDMEDGKARPLSDVKRRFAAWVEKNRPQARRTLLAQGLAAERVDAMPAEQVAVLAALRSYERQRDEIFKWYAIPYWQARAGLERAEKDFEAPAARQASEPFHALLPSVARAYYTATHLDRRVAALRAVEAVRLSAAEHDGRLPASWEEIEGLPVPIDPVTGKPIAFERKGETVVIDLPAPPGMTPDKGDRYVITLAR